MLNDCCVYTFNITRLCSTYRGLWRLVVIQWLLRSIKWRTLCLIFRACCLFTFLYFVSQHQICFYCCLLALTLLVICILLHRGCHHLAIWVDVHHPFKCIHSVVTVWEQSTPTHTAYSTTSIVIQHAHRISQPFGRVNILTLSQKLQGHACSIKFLHKQIHCILLWTMCYSILVYHQIAINLRLAE